MSFETFKNMSTSDKIILFEIDKGEVLSDLLWDRYVPNVWKAVYSWEENKPVETSFYGVGVYGAGNYGIISNTLLPFSENLNTPAIGSLEINGTFYQALDDKDNVQLIPESFHFDVASQVLYVNYGGYLRNPANKIVIGKTAGYSNRAISLENNYYDSRIESLKSLTISRDNLFKKVAVFGGGSVTMHNEDREFSDFGDLDVYGQSVKIRYGSPDLLYSEFKEVYTGTLERWVGSNNKFTINIKDDRKALKTALPINYYKESTYPDLSDFGFGIGIGLGYGDIRRAVPVCVNEAETPAPATYNFKFVDTTNHNIESIDNVYVEGVKVSFSNGSLVNGTFDLSNSVYEPGQIVTIDFHGYTDGVNLIENPLDVIEDLLFYYANIPFNSETYNTVDWNLLKASLTSTVGIYVKESRSLISVIGDATASILGTFVVQGDGKFNMKVVDLTKPVTRFIKYSETLKTVKNDPQFDEYISSARIGYRKNNSNTQYAYHINTDREDELSKRYRQKEQKTFLTNLTTQTQAIAYSEEVMTLYGGMFTKYTVTTGIQNMDLEIEDLITVEVEKISDNLFKTITGELISTTLNLSGGTVQLTIKEFSN